MIPILPIPAAAWFPGAPPHVTKESQEIDRRCAAEAVCPRCRRRGMAYRPMHCGRDYRALAECTCCGEVMEF
jgi:hypothetical protein